MSRRKRRLCTVRGPQASAEDGDGSYPECRWFCQCGGPYQWKPESVSVSGRYEVQTAVEAVSSRAGLLLTKSSCVVANDCSC